ncbi:MAG: carboxylesterase [Desulfofustis sp. PB-SRB1]|jgi:phospholipase/carboxylesterase|nr:carboxylesterase [Desulfofustis sp. PB-SRB1]MBM1002857.1 carboxylesterase [Desulfofustis sp. PB-SRB1]HBH27233.1 carboxylesterase [Desulfofustis sp.]
MTLLPAVERVVGEHPDAACIWLHGLGADGNDFAPIVPQLRLPAHLSIRFIFPHAPERPVTVNGGLVMPAWYDIAEMEIDRRVDIAGIVDSAEMIRAFIDRERERGIASHRILIAGFSQGGAVAYHVALSDPRRLAGLLVMSTYFATAEVIDLHEANRAIPVEVHHGRFDPVVPERLGQEAVTRLTELGYVPTYRRYPMEHGVCPEQIDHVSQWFRTVLDP